MNYVLSVVVILRLHQSDISQFLAIFIHISQCSS